MRTIKFRYWDSFNAELRYCDANEWKDYLSKFFIEHDSALHGQNNPILMQYTGINDCDGSEIYEGDIVEWQIRKEGRKIHHIIIWYHSEYRSIDVMNYVKCSCCNNTIHARTGTKPNQSTWRMFKVIGNIYENPNLIKRG